MNVDYSKDSAISEFAMQTLRERYMLPDEDSPQDAFARVATAFGDNDEHAQRLYDYVSRGWLMFSTPILSNGGTSRGLPISCYLQNVDDSREGILSHYTESGWLSSMGGGLGAYWGNLRADGAKTSKGSLSFGHIPFLKVMDSEVMAFAQGGTRRASYAAYQRIDHPEIEEFINLRKPTGGDVNRKCMNLHNAVCLTDDFMQAVLNNEDWKLIDSNSHKVVKVVSARALWESIIQTRAETGEPYIFFTDTVNRAIPLAHKELGLKIDASNLCVAPETLILTKNGYFPIVKLAGTFAEVWNGFEFSSVNVVKTSQKSKLIRVTFSDGTELDCTEYHKFHLQSGYTRGTGKNVLRLYTKEAKDLVVGEKLQKFELPIIEHYSRRMKDPYTQGVFSGDGCANPNGSNHVDLYGSKEELLLPHMTIKSLYEHQKSSNRRRAILDSAYEKFDVPLDCSIQDRLDWFAGLLDTDGCLLISDGTPQLQIGSVNKDFINKVKLMLQTLGVFSKVLLGAEEGFKPMPDGHGGTKDFFCQKLYRLCISGVSTQQLLKMGLVTHRIKIPSHTCNRDARQFIKVVSVEDLGREDSTYCFNEPLRHTGVFNGIMTGNCSEITLPTSPERTAVCCLSSPNLEYFDEWSKDDLFVEDIIRMLDNVLSSFITKAPESLRRAVFSAMQERSLGMGAMGFHYYLQRNGIPFEGPIAKGINTKIFSHLKSKAVEATRKLAKERGACPDSLLDDPVRNMYLMAVAPNASTSILLNTSPSIEPLAANAFSHKTLSGSFLVKNKYLERLLEEKGRNDSDTWQSIIVNDGSVQHLDFLTEWEKLVFKTAIEIDQQVLVDLAADRQQFICQSQSLNLFFLPDADLSYVNKVHLDAWKKGVKTLYYYRSRALRNADKVAEKIERVVRQETSDCIGCEG